MMHFRSNVLLYFFVGSFVINFFLLQGFFFCREVISFARRFSLWPWSYSFLPRGFFFCREVISFCRIVFFLPWSYFFCRESFFLPWQLWATVSKRLPSPSLCAEHLYYVIPVSAELIKEANSIFYDLIWNGKDKVKRNAFMSEIENGGLNMLDIDCMIRTKRVVYAQRNLWKITRVLGRQF